MPETGMGGPDPELQALEPPEQGNVKSLRHSPVPVRPQSRTEPPMDICPWDAAGIETQLNIISATVDEVGYSDPFGRRRCRTITSPFRRRRPAYRPSQRCRRSTCPCPRHHRPRGFRAPYAQLFQGWTLPQLFSPRQLLRCRELLDRPRLLVCTPGPPVSRPEGAPMG